MEDGLPHGMTRTHQTFGYITVQVKMMGNHQNKTRVHSHSGTEIWDREELFTIMKYEPEIRYKVYLLCYGI